jgi:hypothetical protein
VLDSVLVWVVRSLVVDAYDEVMLVAAIVLEAVAVTCTVELDRMVFGRLTVSVS